MALRQLVIQEEFGLYRFRDNYGLVLGKGTTAEAALADAFHSLTDVDLEIRNNAEAGQVIEDLLGERRDDPEAPVAP